MNVKIENVDEFQTTHKLVVEVWDGERLVQFGSLEEFEQMAVISLAPLQTIVIKQERITA